MNAVPEFPRREAALLYLAPPDEGGRFGGASNPAQLALRQELELRTAGAETGAFPDSEIVTQRATAFLDSLYDTGGYYARHTAGILASYPQYATREIVSEEGRAVAEIDRNTIALHDVLDHAIRHPQAAAARVSARVGFNPAEAPLVAVDIKKSAIAEANEMFKEVGDQDGLMKAYLFANDASHWELAAQMWRAELTDRITTMMNADTPTERMDRRSGEVLIAVINKTPDLEKYSQAELARILELEGKRLIGLELPPLSRAAEAHNIRGLPAKGLETLWNIQNPPKDNLASTIRDCFEAINFLVPGLYALGYDKLATDLRGAVLERFYPDPNGDAERQHKISEQYSEELGAIVGGLQEREFGRAGLRILSREKTNGGLRQKLASPGYEDLRQAPDGIGYAFIVPNGMTPEAREHFARSYQRRLISSQGPYRIEARHPKGTEDEHTFEAHNRENYQVTNMTFYYYPEGGPAEGVPFEIQVLSEAQAKLKRFDGRYSDLRYKAGQADIPASPGDKESLSHMQKRGEAEHAMMPASTVQSIAECVVTSPGLEYFVFNALYQAVETPDAGGVLVPHELADAARAISSRLAEVSGDPGDLTVLPPTYLAEEQFVKALNLLGLDAREDPNIKNALTFIKESEAGNTRDDGKTPIVEGHLLPTALMALMLARQSGKIWDSELGPTEYMSNVVTAALLHDTVETELQKLKNGGADTEFILQRRKERLFDIANQYGEAVMKAVDAMTLHVEIEDQEMRRSQYRQDVQANEYARYALKPADRWNNHMADIIQLATGQAPPGSALYQKKMRYAAKTDRHQSADFTAAELPDVYRRIHYTLWAFLKSFGYQPEAK